MRLRMLPMLVAVPLLVAACGDDDSVRVLDEASLEGPDGIEKILVNDYKIEEIQRIDCPTNPVVAEGNEFECTVDVDGDGPRKLTVPVTITDDDGTYQVGLPEEPK
jgi:hypothetical protein